MRRRDLWGRCSRQVTIAGEPFDRQKIVVGRFALVTLQVFQLGGVFLVHSEEVQDASYKEYRIEKVPEKRMKEL